MESPILSFSAFVLDVADERLWREGTEVKLRHKPFAILRYMVAHPQRLVTQEELVKAVWGTMAMSESLLRTHVRELRQVLGVGIVETVAGRGYRFLAEVQSAQRPDDLRERFGESSAEHPQVSALNQNGISAGLAGRETELEILHASFRKALDRKRQIVFVTGEPGIGKTSLVDAFFEQIALAGGVYLIRGSCIEQFGSGEAYLPIFVALAGACREPGGERIVDILLRHAPTWLTQIPGLVADDKLETLLLRVRDATPGRMLRELADALDVVAEGRPIVLALEDLQWADRSTIEVIDLLGRRREAARFLLIGTCRSEEVARGGSLNKVIAELTTHKQATLLRLESLSEAGIAALLDRRFPEHAFPAELASTIYWMTAGNPLFSGALIDDLENRRMVHRSEGRWLFSSTAAEIANRRPDTIRQLIDIQMDRVSSTIQRVLEVASLVGVRFNVGVVAHALDMTVDDVDACCESLANERRFLKFAGAEQWPDGSVQSEYTFVHTLYQDAALSRSSSGQRRIWHRRIAERLEIAFAGSTEMVATMLAIHFETAQNFAKASGYYAAAGERSIRRLGRSAALLQFEKARDLVARLPPSREAEQLELAALKNLGHISFGLNQLEDPNLVSTFERAAQLAERLGDDEALCESLLGLQRCRVIEGRLSEVQIHSDALRSVLKRTFDPVVEAEATLSSSLTGLFRGQLVESTHALSSACSVLDAAAPLRSPRVLSRNNVGVERGFLALGAWLLGEPDSALAQSEQAVRRAESSADPVAIAVALSLTATVHMYRRDLPRTLQTALQACQVAADAGSRMWQARSAVILHWARIQLDPSSAAEHLDEAARQLAEAVRTAPFCTTALAHCVVESCLVGGRTDSALQQLSKALAFAERSDERAWEPELHRLHGEALKSTDMAGAQRCFVRALEMARSQASKSFELRAAMSWHRHAHGPTARKQSLDAVRNSYETFSQGFETGDLLSAQTLLER